MYNVFPKEFQNRDIREDKHKTEDFKTKLYFLIAFSRSSKSESIEVFLDILPYWEFKPGASAKDDYSLD